MSSNSSDQGNVDLINGEFFTDGRTFVFRLAGTPISGTGNTAAAAFEDLMRAEASTGALTQRLKELARDQQGEVVRATVVRSAMVGLVALGIVAGALFGAAAMLPRVVASVTDSTTARLNNWLEQMPPTTRERIAEIVQRASSLARPSDAACAPPAKSAPDAAK
jgi:hypothetical protein